MPGTEPASLGIDIECLLPLLLGQIFNRSNTRTNTRIVHQHIQPAKMIAETCSHLLHLVALGHVAHQFQHLPS